MSTVQTSDDADDKRLWRSHKFPKMGDGARVHYQGARALLAATDNIIPFAKATSVLDIACGQGAVYDVLFSSDIAISPSAALLATDISDLMLENIFELQKQTEPGLWARVRAWNEDATKMSLRDNSQSHVLSQMGIFLISDHKQALLEAHRVLAPDGVFCMTAVVETSWHEVMHATLSALVPDRMASWPSLPEVWKDEEQFAAKLENGGFHSVVMQRVPLLMSFESSEELIQTLFRAMPYIQPTFQGLSESKIYELEQAATQAFDERYPDHKLPGAALMATARK